MQQVRFTRRGLLAAAGMWLPASRLLGADEDEHAKFSSDVKVVSVLATVHDKKGVIIRNLRKEDFTLQEDGRTQLIRYFSQQTEQPLTLGLLVDTSGSQRRVLGKERDASRTFIRQVLREDKDQTFLIHFDREVELLQDLTSSKAKLEKALDDMSGAEAPQMQRRQGGSAGGGYPGGNAGGGYPGGGQGGNGGRRGAGGGTALYDSVLLASNELMRKQTGRKALMLLSDGVDMGSKVGISESIEAAQRADTLVFSILFEDKSAYGSPLRSLGGYGGRGGGRRGGPGRGGIATHPDGKKVLQRIALETGGSFFEVSDKHPIEKVYSQIEEELRNQYSLGYTSDSTSGPGFRKITLTAKDKNMLVQTRQGYYAK